MSNHSEPDSPHELEDVAARLRAERPRLTGLELDEMRQRVRARSTVSLPNNRRQMIMKSRMVVTMMLVLGMVFSTAGAGLAVSGLTGSGNAGDRVYEQDQTLQGTLGEVQTVQPSTPETPDEPTPPAPAPRATAQVPQQVAAAESGDELPFTGFTAIPVLIGGIALLGGGLALRRKTD
jgi:hypothetical protein